MRFNITDNVIVRALNKICDMCCLNVLWLVCCIPVFTIGASTTALYTVMLKMVKNEEGYIFRSFFKAFKENFRQSTIMWLILLVTSIVCFIDFRVAGVIAGAPGTVLRGIFFLLGFFLLAVMAYTFPLTARYENTIRATLRNAALLSVGRLPYTLLLVALPVVAVVASLWNSVTLMFAIPLWFLIGGSLLAWVNSYILLRAFSVFENKEDSDNDSNVTETEDKR